MCMNGSTLLEKLDAHTWPYRRLKPDLLWEMRVGSFVFNSPFFSLKRTHSIWHLLDTYAENCEIRRCANKYTKLCKSNDVLVLQQNLK